MFRLLGVFTWLLLGAIMTQAQSPLEPPLGLHWGDSPEKLIDWSAKHSLDVNISLPADQPGLRIVRAESRNGAIPEISAAAVEGRFLAGKLYELTVHHIDPQASSDLMETRFEKLRKDLTQLHGPMLQNQQQRTVEDQFVTRTESFHREPVKGLFLLLAYTEVEDLLRKSKDARYSVIYRNDNFRREIRDTLLGK